MHEIAEHQKYPVFREKPIRGNIPDNLNNQVESLFSLHPQKNKPLPGKILGSRCFSSNNVCQTGFDNRLLKPLLNTDENLHQSQKNSTLFYNRQAAGFRRQ